MRSFAVIEQWKTADVIESRKKIRAICVRRYRRFDESSESGFWTRMVFLICVRVDRIRDLEFHSNVRFTAILIVLFNIYYT